jgi:hypothetical protein
LSDLVIGGPGRLRKIFRFLEDIHYLIMDILPFLHPVVGEKVLPAVFSYLIPAASGFQLFVIGIPHLDKGQ